MSPYLLIAGGTALLTVLITTDSYQLLLLPFLSLSQIDWGTVPSLIQCARGGSRLLTGRKESELPSCYPDIAANFQILGLFSAHVDWQNRVAVELAKRVCVGESHTIAAVDPGLTSDVPAPRETPSSAPSAKEGEAEPQDAEHKWAAMTGNRHQRPHAGIAQLCTEASLIEKLKSDQRRQMPAEEGDPPRWSCEGLCRPEGKGAQKESSATRTGLARSRWPVLRWRTSPRHHPFRGGSTAA